MKLKGRVINDGNVSAQAVVLNEPFSFIGDFDPNTGTYSVDGHPLFGESLANKILVCPTGKGGTIAPFIAYLAQQNGNAPAGVLCDKAEPIICESAITIDIPMVDRFSKNPVDVIRSGQWVTINGADVTVSEKAPG